MEVEKKEWKKGNDNRTEYRMGEKKGEWRRVEGGMEERGGQDREGTKGGKGAEAKIVLTY